MFFIFFGKRTQTLGIVLGIAVIALAALLWLMSKLAASETPVSAPGVSASADQTVTPPATTPQDLGEVVATVNDQLITQEAWRQASRLDTIMSQLAGQPVPTAEETLDRLVNEIIVLNAVSTRSPISEQETEARIQALETNWQVTDEQVVAALAKMDLARSDLTARTKRLILVEGALKQLGLSANDLTTWLAQARAAAKIGLYHSLVAASPAPTPPLNAPEASPAAIPSEAPDSSPLTFAPPPAVAVSPYPQNAAPDFTLAQLKGEPLTLSRFRGKPTLINFWATWCPPCRRELPALQAAYVKYQDRIGFIAVNVKEDPGTVTALVQELGLSFPIALDPDGQVSNLAYEVRGIPTTIFVDANGVVTARHLGPLDDAAIDSYLKPLLETAAQMELEGNSDSAQPPNPPTLQPSLSPTLSSAIPPAIEAAPDFTLTAANGDTVALKDYRNKANVVLVFYRGYT